MREKRNNALLRTVVLLGVVVFGLLAMRAAFFGFYRHAYPTGYQDIVLREAQKNNLPVDLVFAVIRTESGFRPEVQSSVGARGLMQLTEETFDWTKSKMTDAGDETYADLYDPEMNIRYGCKLLRLLLDEFQNEDTAMCAYHAGWGSAKRWLADDEHSADGVSIHSIPYDDTRNYVAKIAQTRDIYQKLYDFI